MKLLQTVLLTIIVVMLLWSRESVRSARERLASAMTRDRPVPHDQWADVVCRPLGLEPDSFPASRDTPRGLWLLNCR